MYRPLAPGETRRLGIDLSTFNCLVAKEDNRFGVRVKLHLKLEDGIFVDVPSQLKFFEISKTR